MKHLLSVAVLALTAGSAVAADLPARKEPLLPPPPPPPMWTGFYAGLNAGGTWANSNYANATPVRLLPSLASPILFSGSFPTGTSVGFIGGGQIGFNWLAPILNNNILVGLEADIQGVAGSGGSASTSRLAVYPRFGATQYMLSNTRASASLDYFGTVRGRLGYRVAPTLLVYGTGGLAYGGVNFNIRNGQAYTDTPDRVMLGTAGISNTQVGWTAGGGAEWMFMQNWSAKVEYLYYDLGSVSASPYNTEVFFDPPTRTNSITPTTYRFNGNIVRAGVNYHFNWGSFPVVASY